MTRYIVELEPGVWLTWPPTSCLISRETRHIEYAARYPSSEMAQIVVDHLHRYPNAKIIEVWGEFITSDPENKP